MTLVGHFLSPCMAQDLTLLPSFSYSDLPNDWSPDECPRRMPPAVWRWTLRCPVKTTNLWLYLTLLRSSSPCHLPSQVRRLVLRHSVSLFWCKMERILFFSLAATFAFMPMSAFNSLKKRPSCFSGSSASQAPGLQDHVLDKSAAGVGSLFTGLLRLAQVPSDTCLSP